MEHWIAYKIQNKKFIYIWGIDLFGNIKHTKNKSEAYKFYNFNEAMYYCNLGYCITKEVKQQ